MEVIDLAPFMCKNSKTKMSKKSEEQIEKIQKDLGYETALDIPVWQAHYNSYGGYDEYIKVRDFYWDVASFYLYPGTEYTPTNFPLVKVDSDIKDLLKKFRQDLGVELTLPKKYDIYR